MTQAIEIPALSLVLVQGPRGAGKSELCARLFAPGEVLAPAGESPEERAALEAAVGERLGQGLLTVVDAPNLITSEVDPLLHLARRHLVRVVCLALEPDPQACAARGGARPKAVAEQLRQLAQARKALRKNRNVAAVHALADGRALERIERRPLDCDRRDQAGPFDVIGDVHGCLDELQELLQRLGYEPDGQHPQGRRLVFVGDLCDRGPHVLGVLRRVMDLVAAGGAFCVLGNHDDKLRRWLEGAKVKVSRGLRVTVDELEALPAPGAPAFRARLGDFLRALPVHLVLDGGRLVVAHAGLKQAMIGRQGSKLRAFALYGDTTGHTDAEGYPIRRDWAAGYRGEATIVYGHTPVPAPVWRNRTANVDQGCCFGGALTAARWPEGDFVSVPARRVHWDRSGGA